MTDIFKIKLIGLLDDRCKKHQKIGVLLSGFKRPTFSDLEKQRRCEYRETRLRCFGVKI